MCEREGRVDSSARWMSHVTQINESCHIYECVILQLYMNVYMWEGGMSVFEHSMNESCHADQWVLSHIWMCHITAVHECVCVRGGGRVCLYICHITGVHECVYVRGKGEFVWALDERVMARRSMSRVTYMNVSYYRCTWMCMRDKRGWVCLSARWMSHVM